MNTQLIPLATHDTFDEHPGPYNGSVQRQMKPFGVHGMHLTSLRMPTHSLAVLRARLSEGVTSPTSGDTLLPGECLCLKEIDQVPPAKNTSFSRPSDLKRYWTSIVSRLCSIGLTSVGNLCYLCSKGVRNVFSLVCAQSVQFVLLVIDSL